MWSPGQLIRPSKFGSAVERKMRNTSTLFLLFCEHQICPWWKLSLYRNEKAASSSSSLMRVKTFINYYYYTHSSIVQKLHQPTMKWNKKNCENTDPRRACLPCTLSVIFCIIYYIISLKSFKWVVSKQDPLIMIYFTSNFCDTIKYFP